MIYDTFPKRIIFTTCTSIVNNFFLLEMFVIKRFGDFAKSISPLEFHKAYSHIDKCKNLYDLRANF